MSEIKKESIDSHQRHDFMNNCTWSNDWLYSNYCHACDTMFFLEILKFDIYKVKDYLYFCEKCYFNIQRAHANRGVIWKGELHLRWESVILQ